MIFAATQIIADTFEKIGIKFRIEEDNDSSCVTAGYYIPGGPYVNIRFISSDDDNDVAVKVFSLFNKVPNEKEFAILRAFNDIHNRVRYATFYFDEDMDINIDYDLPSKISSDNLGEVCFETLFNLTRILRIGHHIIAQALEPDGECFDSHFDDQAI